MVKTIGSAMLSPQQAVSRSISVRRIVTPLVVGLTYNIRTSDCSLTRTFRISTPDVLSEITSFARQLAVIHVALTENLVLVV